MWIRKNHKDRLSGKNLPLPTQVVSNEEFTPMPQTMDQKTVESLILEMADEYGRKLGLSRRAFLPDHRRHGGRIPGDEPGLRRIVQGQSEAEVTGTRSVCRKMAERPVHLRRADAPRQRQHCRADCMFRKMTGKLGMNPGIGR